MALDIAWSNFTPHVAEHVPGVANVICDMLSRLHQPNKAFVLPDELAYVREIVLPERRRDYYQTLDRPPGTH